jgi:Skp family chaperone for outer membrane proteins
MSQQIRAAALTIILGAMFFPQRGVAQELRIAVVDIETLTFMTDEGKAVSEKLKKRFEEISALMQKSQTEIEAKEKTRRDGDRALSTAAKQTLDREIENLKIAFERKNQDYQKEYTDFQNELIDPVAAKAQIMLQKYIKEKNFTMVLDLSAENGNIRWSNPANDITPEVIKLLNEEYKKNPAAAAPPAAARPAGGATPPASNATRPPASTIPPAPTTPRP